MDGTAGDALRVNGTTADLALALPGLADTTTHHTIIGRLTGVTVEAWVDGSYVTNIIGTALETGANSMYPSIGAVALNSSPTLAFDGHVYMAALWHKTLPDSDLLLLERDPYGMVRVDAGPEVWEEAAVADDVNRTNIIFVAAN